MKLGKSTLIALTVIPLVSLYLLTATAATYLTEGLKPQARFIAAVSGFLLLALVYHFMSRRWPTIFSDRIQERGPVLNVRRVGILIAMMVLWAAAFVWLMTTRALEGWVTLNWPWKAAGWYLVLVITIHLVESIWRRHDASRVH